MDIKKSNFSHIKLTFVTHFYCNQKNINSVIDLFKKYEKFSDSLLDVIYFVIVDDGSPIEYSLPEFNLNMTWLKITDDIPWNQSGARNLGVTYAKSDKIVMSDLDHEFYEETLWHMVNRSNPGRCFYKIYRDAVNSSGLQKGHSNLFFMSRARFMRHFGYDEEFSGHHGAEDYRFVKYHKYHGSKQKYLPRRFRCRERELDRESSWHSLERDTGLSTFMDTKKQEEIKRYGAEHGHSRQFLNFHWMIYATFSRAKPVEQKHPLWQPLWWFRYLIPYLAK